MFCALIKLSTCSVIVKLQLLMEQQLLLILSHELNSVFALAPSALCGNKSRENPTAWLITIEALVGKKFKNSPAIFISYIL